MGDLGMGMAHKGGKPAPGRGSPRVGSTAAAQAGQKSIARVHAGVWQAKLRVGPSKDAFECEADVAAEAVMRTEPRRWSAAGLSLQAKLEIGAADDPLEHEADRIADQAIRQPAREATTVTASPRLSRKCATGDKEKGTLQMKLSDTPEAAVEAPPIVHEVLRSSGQPLDAPTRSHFENRLGRDLGAVRVHFDAKAAASARAVNAQAYTVGRHVAFAAGRYAPNTPEGGWLLAHELVHTIQQGATPQGGVRRGAPSHAGTWSPRLRRFGSREHIQIGDLASPGQMVFIGGYGTVPLSALSAMAGDYFESLDQLKNVAKQGDFGKQQIDLVLWMVNGKRGPKPAVGSGAEAAVGERYDDLASRNQAHFSTGGSPGVSNRERYIDLHTQAVSAAYQAGAFAIGAIRVFPDDTPEALEGFAEHFLADAFSAGHVRTPRGELKSYWNGKYPDFGSHLIDFISCNMATYIKEVDKSSHSAKLIRDGVGWPLNRQGVKDTVVRLAGKKLANYALGDLISKALHDADSGGLDVTSGSDWTGSGKSFKWRAVGDDKLFPGSPNKAADQTREMVVTALKWSRAEVQQAVNAGLGITNTRLSRLVDQKYYRALSLIPTENKSSTTNPTYAWKVNDVRSLPATVKDAVRSEFEPGTEVRKTLDEVSAPTCSGEYHSGAAWDCFKKILLRDPIDALAKTAEGATCPPSNPCPEMIPETKCP